MEAYSFLQLSKQHLNFLSSSSSLLLTKLRRLLLPWAGFYAYLSEYVIGLQLGLQILVLLKEILILLLKGFKGRFKIDFPFSGKMSRDEVGRIEKGLGMKEESGVEWAGHA